MLLHAQRCKNTEVKFSTNKMKSYKKEKHMRKGETLSRQQTGGFRREEEEPDCKVAQDKSRPLVGSKGGLEEINISCVSMRRSGPSDEVMRVQRCLSQTVLVFAHSQLEPSTGVKLSVKRFETLALGRW